MILQQLALYSLLGFASAWPTTEVNAASSPDIIYTNHPDPSSLDQAKLQKTQEELRENTRSISADGSGLAIQGLFFHKTHDDWARWHQANFGEDASGLNETIASMHARESGDYESVSSVQKRYTLTCQTPSCHASGPNDIRDFYASDVFGYIQHAGCANAATQVRPGAFQAVSVLFKNAPCKNGGSGSKTTCGATFEIHALKKGQNVGAGIQNTCPQATSKLSGKCGIQSSSVTCTIAGGGTYGVSMTARSSPNPPSCPTISNGEDFCTPFILCNSANDNCS